MNCTAPFRNSRKYLTTYQIETICRSTKHSQRTIPPKATTYIQQNTHIEYLIMPIHQPGHWTIAIKHHPHKEAQSTFWHINTIAQPTRNSTRTTNESIQKIQQSALYQPHTDKWEQLNTITQPNQHDCGTLILMIAYTFMTYQSPLHINWTTCRNPDTVSSLATKMRWYVAHILCTTHTQPTPPHITHPGHKNKTQRQKIHPRNHTQHTPTENQPSNKRLKSNNPPNNDSIGTTRTQSRKPKAKQRGTKRKIPYNTPNCWGLSLHPLLGCVSTSHYI